jgi:hypothetical protein
MTHERKEEIVAKIMKLMELGNEENNSNPHEREAASRKAAEMMANYAIDFADLRSEKPKEDVFITIEVDGSADVKIDYESHLAFNIAHAFDCEMINTYRKGPWQIMFLGTKNDLEIAVFFFKHLRRTLSAMARLKFPRDSHHSRKNYCFGLVTTVGERLEDLYKRREEFIPSDCRALVVVKKENLQNYFNQQFPDRSHGRRTQFKGNLEAYHQGKADGKTINLNRPISHTGGATAQIG